MQNFFTFWKSSSLPYHPSLSLNLSHSFKPYDLLVKLTYQIGVENLIMAYFPILVYINIHHDNLFSLLPVHRVPEMKPLKNRCLISLSLYLCCQHACLDQFAVVLVEPDFLLLLFRIYFLKVWLKVRRTKKLLFIHCQTKGLLLVQLR